MPALAYLLTFCTYGTHLPGSEKGWVDAQHCLRGTPMRPHNPSREAYWRVHLNESPWVLDRGARLLTLEVILTVCTHRPWIAYAVHIRTNHVHAVIGGEGKPERMLSDFKAYATRAFRSAAGVPKRRRFWTDHGSTRYLWKQASLEAAIDYVLNGQGVGMARYPDKPVD
jgi:REP element-mobilizing transposase RayT